ncbi:putative ibr domain-containing protein [Phaeoacremonium minimum UCRPA7]|uniref:RBR-type E3 ubiquitin transferase n=1 Tax=Phaeoacremonium minimum (strain UCR-PA7) TaxID=1286976 RepID=R8BCF7_PHAM7|nr:putative ibr domain-containing protein [Phaeoacremonium minimum UCRPA7]EON96989.1 putative ibr domain-containing protein [Phaeoacremonium minimum UCRPA7]
MEYEDVQRYADDDTKTRYQDLTFRHAMSESPHFIWCTAGCGSGQIHDSGSQQPIVACVKCGARSCFHHSVPWHENLSCDEYDALLADPEKFRSRFEIDNDEVATADEARRAQEDADRAYAQSLLAEEQRAVDEERRERLRREEEARTARQRAEREEQQRTLAEQRKIAARRMYQEDESQKTIARTTKPCPGCGWAIEKNAGW